jgi:hypothetical protein
MTDYQIVDAMLTYGGSFVQSLAQAWRCADAQNQARLKAAFPDYWDHYRELAEMQERHAAERTT